MLDFAGAIISVNLYSPDSGSAIVSDDDNESSECWSYCRRVNSFRASHRLRYERRPLTDCVSLGKGHGLARDIAVSAGESGKTMKSTWNIGRGRGAEKLAPLPRPEHLAEVLTRTPSKRFVMMGDFSQTIARSSRRQSGKAAHRADLLQTAIPAHVTLASSALEHDGRRTTHHIGLSASMSIMHLDAISSFNGE